METYQKFEFLWKTETNCVPKMSFLHSRRWFIFDSLRFIFSISTLFAFDRFCTHRRIDSWPSTFPHPIFFLDGKHQIEWRLRKRLKPIAEQMKSWIPSCKTESSFNFGFDAVAIFATLQSGIRSEWRKPFHKLLRLRRPFYFAAAGYTVIALAICNK